MKIKNILLGVLFGLVGFGAVYATLAPNIAGWPTITTANPNNYYTIIQSGTTQGKISMTNFANSINNLLVSWTNIDTGFNNTGSDTIIPSEKAVWGLVSGMNNTYIPYRSGNKFYNSIMQQGSSSITGFVIAVNKPSIAGDGIVINNAAKGIYMSGINPAMYISTTLNGINISQKGYSGTIGNATAMNITRTNTSTSSYTNGIVVITNMGNKVSNMIEFKSGTTVMAYVSASGDFNSTGIIGSQKGYCIGTSCIANRSTIGLNNTFIPYRSGDRFYNSNMLFYTNTHVGTYSAGDTALFNIRKIGSSLKGINITLYTGGLYNGIGLDIRASKPIITTTQNIGDPFNTTNIANNSEDNGGYFITNYVSDIGGYSSMISKGGIVGVANGASVSTSSLAGFYIMSGVSSLSSTNGSWRIVMSGVNLSIQILSGGAWIEKGHFTP